MAQYSAKDVRVLEEVEHIRLNPGMYIGETSNPVHLIEEALDNALDEALAGYAKIIAILIDTKKNIYSVIDSGRGIPIDKDTPVTISSKLFSGAKFQDKKSAYQISSGLHGVGLVAVNALSDIYNVEVYRNKQHAIYQFKKAKLKLKKIDKHTGDYPFSTKIEFKPNKKYFDDLVPDIDRIRMRLTTASAELPSDISFVLIVDGKQEVINRDMTTHFAKECLSSHDRITVTLNIR
jgi:topoisomerase-4 subunit B